MAVPRNRTSNARKNSRRSHHAKVLKEIILCSNCKNKRLAHRVCHSCGHYDGRQVIAMNASGE